MFANLLLFSYFASKGEGSATFVQIIGVTSTAVLLVQVTFREHSGKSTFREHAWKFHGTLRKHSA
jgi:hypothetical protein